MITKKVSIEHSQISIQKDHNTNSTGKFNSAPCRIPDGYRGRRARKRGVQRRRGVRRRRWARLGGGPARDLSMGLF